MPEAAVPKTSAGPESPLVLACLAATWFVWGSTYLAIRFALVGLPPFLMMASRFVVAGALLLAYTRARGAPWPKATEWRNAAIVGALMLGCGMGGTAQAEQTIASGLVVSFLAVTPLLMVIASLPFGVRPGRAEVIGTLVGFGGVLMLVRGDGFRASPVGLGWLVIASSGWTIGSVLSQRVLRLASGATGYASEMLAGGLVLAAFDTRFMTQRLQTVAADFVYRENNWTAGLALRDNTLATVFFGLTVVLALSWITSHERRFSVSCLR